MAKTLPQPLGLITLVDPITGKTIADSSDGVWEMGPIYSAIGISRDLLADWGNRYRMGNRVINEKQIYIKPDFPVFSKIAWMYIDPVDLSPVESKSLVEECDRIIDKSIDPVLRNQVTGIRQIAIKAIRESLLLRCGHP